MSRPTPASLRETLFDLVVIGGGITGAAAARDAAMRGLSTLLVEKDDFAAGTSSRSSKLIHGGLRYLQTYQFGLVAESLRERERLLRLAPHLTEVRPFLYLLYRGDPETRALLSLGLTFYDVASGAWLRRRHRMLSPRQVLDREPHLRSEDLLGAGLFHDALTDDARLTLDTVKAADRSGATVLNHATVTGLVLENGTARGVRVADEISGETVEVHARQVLNATGPWADVTRSLETGAPGTSAVDDGSGGLRLRPTKGVHIVLRREDFPLSTALFLRSPDDNRVVWPIPSRDGEHVYIGTTDTDYSGDLDHVVPDEADVQYLLNVANRAVPTARVTTDHVVGSWAGLRPLVAPPPGTSESNTPREHVITTGPTGMITIAGGKLTSNLVMAKHLIDAAEKALGRRRTASAARKTPVAGGAPVDPGVVLRQAVDAGVPEPIARSWVRRYGSDTHRLITRWRTEPAARREIGAGLTVGEVEHAVRREMCGSLDDLMVRRTSLFFWSADGGLGQIDDIAGVLGGLLGWDDATREDEIARYEAKVAEHRPGRTVTRGGGRAAPAAG
ncbi:MAG: glycerol-3-phosphate dehydrogenase/oxidase [Actinomycetaceae bacterium]